MWCQEVRSVIVSASSVHSRRDTWMVQMRIPSSKIVEQDFSLTSPYHASIHVRCYRFISTPRQAPRLTSSFLRSSSACAPVSQPRLDSPMDHCSELKQSDFVISQVMSPCSARVAFIDFPGIEM